MPVPTSKRGRPTKQPRSCWRRTPGAPTWSRCCSPEARARGRATSAARRRSARRWIRATPTPPPCCESTPLPGRGEDPAGVTTDTTGVRSGSAWDRFAQGPGAPLALIAVGLVFQLPIFDRWFSFMDEGHILVYADIIARGGELYRDATVYPLPGSFYLLAWAFRLFGTSNLVARWILVVEFSVLVGLVFVLLRRMVPAGWALAGALSMLPYRIWAFPHWHMYSYSSTALLLLFSALLGVVRFTAGGQRRWLLLSGLLFGLGVACKQDYGAAALVAISLVLFATARTSAASSFVQLFGWFIAPAAAVGVATAVHFLRQGLFGDLVRFTVLHHLIGMANYEYPRFPPLFPILGQDPFLRSNAGHSAYMPAIVNTLDLPRVLESSWYRDTALYDLALKLYYFAPYPMVAFGAARLWARRRLLRDPSARPAALAELALWAFGSTLIALVTLNRPQDYVHLAVLYWPLLCLGVVYLRAFVQGRRALALSLVAVGAVPAALALAYTGSLAWRLRTVHSTPVASKRSGLYVTPEQAQLLDGLVDYIRAHTAPGEPVAVMPYFPILHFYAQRPGPHRASYIVWPFPEIPDRERSIIQALEATHTKLLIYNLNEFLVFEDMAHYAPQLFAYLVEHFEMDRIFSYEWLGYRIGAALRVDGAAPGRRLRPLESEGVA